MSSQLTRIEIVATRWNAWGKVYFLECGRGLRDGEQKMGDYVFMSVSQVNPRGMMMMERVDGVSIVTIG